MRIGEAVLGARKRAGMTQQQVAEKTGISKEHIGMIEVGNVTSPRTDTLQKIAIAVECTMADLIEDVDFIKEVYKQ